MAEVTFPAYETAIGTEIDYALHGQREGIPLEQRRADVADRSHGAPFFLIVAFGMQFAPAADVLELAAPDPRLADLAAAPVPDPDDMAALLAAAVVALLPPGWGAVPPQGYTVTG